MSRSPGVAAIIPCFRHASLVGTAIRSVIDQSPSASEIIVVDDGFDDDVAGVVLAFPGVRLLRQENRGPAAARNTGLRAAVSEKVVFLDADDRLLPGAIRAGLDCFETYPDAAFVYGAYEEVSDGIATRRFTPAVTYADLIRCNWVAMIGTVMFDRATLARTGAFDETLRICEDWEVYLRLARSGSFACHSSTVAQYVRGTGNTTHDLDQLKRWIAVVRDREKERGLGEAEMIAWREGESVWRSFYPDGPASAVGRLSRKVAGLLNVGRAAG